MFLPHKLCGWWVPRICMVGVVDLNFFKFWSWYPDRWRRYIKSSGGLPECAERVTVSPWGFRGQSCVHQKLWCIHNRRQPFTTVCADAARVSSKSILPKRQVRAPHKSVKKACQVRVFHKSVKYERPTRESNEHVKSECPARVWRKSARPACQVESVTSFVFVLSEWCQHSGLWAYCLFRCHVLKQMQVTIMKHHHSSELLTGHDSPVNFLRSYIWPLAASAFRPGPGN